MEWNANVAKPCSKKTNNITKGSVYIFKKKETNKQS
jgi:hypothetical protein